MSSTSTLKPREGRRQQHHLHLPLLLVQSSSWQFSHQNPGNGLLKDDGTGKMESLLVSSPLKTHGKKERKQDATIAFPIFSNHLNGQSSLVMMMMMKMVGPYGDDVIMEWIMQSRVELVPNFEVTGYILDFHLGHIH